MTPRILGFLSAAVLPIALVSATGCEESVTYAYFSVDVKFDQSTDPDLLRRVASCAATVQGARESTGELHCAAGTRNLGKFEYSTSAKSGMVRFTVTINDVTGTEIANGTSPEVNIVPNQTVETSVVVVPVPSALPDGGR